MSAVIAWFSANLGLVLGAVYGLLNLITALTKTTKDDNIVAVIKSFLDRFSILTNSDGEGTVKIPGTASKPILTERTNLKEPPKL